MTKAEKPFWQTFLLFVLPMMAANMLQSLQGTINNIFIGRLLGTDALAAASVFFPIMFLFIAFLIGMSAGGSVLIGQAFGARDHAKVKAITGTILTVVLIGGVVIGISTGIYSRNLMMLLGTPANILDDAVRFARVSFLSMPVMFLFFVSSAMLRGVGDTVTPLYSLVLSTIIGAFITPALIQGWLGLPQLGVEAAAYASLIAFTISTIALGFYLRWKRHPMAPDAALLRNMKPDMKILLLTLKLGIPTGVQMITGAVAGIVIIGLVNAFGSNATAAFGAVNQVLSYVQFPAISISIAASIFGAQAIGAGQVDRLHKVALTALQMNIALTGSLVLIVYLASHWIVGLFVTDAAVVALSQMLLNIVTWSSLLFGAGAVLGGIMRASGTVLPPMIIGIGCIVLLEVPLAIFLSRAIGIQGIWWAYAANFSMMMVLNALYYWFVWRNKPIKRLV
ncbi:MATE efflux family protein [Ketogulonicigenium robustum]|uniref:MATE efflux family protein n=1 Tax=Ketogulonicigenium robustum TaxID=92947 RepID=A0A1W6P296_9RHOB|nr:MATE family efflux transporter [Ketogulonicigenium robustum]ARO15635.1 MATE efflux family protein [Ketogulonicigenium robustum]